MKEKSVVMISLDRERPIRLDLNALCEFESVSGLTIEELGQKLQAGRFSLDIIRKLLWAGLGTFDHGLRRDRERGLELVGKLIAERAVGDNFGDRLGYVTQKVLEAFAAQFPDPQPPAVEGLTAGPGASPTASASPTGTSVSPPGSSGT